MLRRDKDGNLLFEDFQIIFKNFSGREGTYNTEGERSFSVLIDDPTIAQMLSDEGWNIRILKPRDDQEEPNHSLQIKVTQRKRDGRGFTKLPPIHLHSDGNEVVLNENTVGELDYANIKSTYFSVRGYQYEPGKISAWLNLMHVELEEDPFASRYKHSEPEDLPFH